MALVKDIDDLPFFDPYRRKDYKFNAHQLILIRDILRRINHNLKSGSKINLTYDMFPQSAYNNYINFNEENFLKYVFLIRYGLSLIDTEIKVTPIKTSIKCVFKEEWIPTKIHYRSKFFLKLSNNKKIWQKDINHVKKPITFDDFCKILYDQAIFK